MRCESTVELINSEVGQQGQLSWRGAEKHRVRIGALTWSGIKGRPSYLTLAELRNSLSVISSHVSSQTQLVLCSGRRVYGIDDNLSVTEDVLTASGDVPVVFERGRADQAGFEYGEVWLVGPNDEAQARKSLLRYFQQINSSQELEAYGQELAEAVSQGSGVISFKDHSLKLVLLQSDEAMMLNLRGDNSSAFCKQAEGLDKVLGSSWLALNSCGSPFEDCKNSGLMRVFGPNGEPSLFGRFVGTKRQFDDGTVSPVGLVHVNTFELGDESSIERSTLAWSASSFDAVAPARVLGSEVLDSSGLRYVEYEFESDV